MAILADMRAFYRWLDEAIEKELVERRAALKRFAQDYEGESIAREARAFIKKIEGEMLARKLKI